MAAPRTPRLSLAEAKARLAALPEYQKGEIIDGELYVQPRPRFRHARTSLFLGHHIAGPFDYGTSGPGGWWILIEPGIDLPGSPEVAPDLAGWRRTTLPAPPAEGEPLRTVPDWVCEVLSPSNARYDLRVKQPFYARIGVPWLWLIDTRQETLQINQLVGDRWSIHGVWSDEAGARLPPFDTIELPLAALWASMRPLPTEEPR